MKKTIINPPSTFPPYLHSRSLAVSHHRFLPPSLPPLAPSVPPTFYSPSPLPCLTPSLPPSLPPPSLPPAPCSLRPSHLLFSLAPSLSHTIASSFPPSLPPLAPSVPPTFYSPSLLPCPSLPACLLPCNSIYTVCVCVCVCIQCW